MQSIPVSQELVIDGSAKPIEDGILFHATRTYNRENAPSTFFKVVTFESSTWNYREGLNLSSGFFTVPSKGSYMFEAVVLKTMYLQVNGVYVKWSEEGEQREYSTTVTNIALLTLNAGDRVNLFNYKAINPFESLIITISFKGFRLNKNN